MPWSNASASQRDTLAVMTSVRRLYRLRLVILAPILLSIAACSDTSGGPLPGGCLVEFYIAVNASNPDTGVVAEVQRARREGRPSRVDLQGAQWFPIRDVTKWADGPDDMKALEENPTDFFARRSRIVVAKEGDTYYQLLYTDSQRSMIHSPQTPWSIESVYYSLDRLGRPAVGFDFDIAGAGQMARLSGPHVGEPLAIVIDNDVYSSPTLQSQIGRRCIITANFTNDDVKQLIDLLRQGSPSSTQPAAAPSQPARQRGSSTRP